MRWSPPTPVTERNHPRCGESSGGPCLAACHQWEPRRTPGKRVPEAQVRGRSLTTQPPDGSDETRARGPLPTAHTPRCCRVHPQGACPHAPPSTSLVTLGGIPGLSLHICPQRASGHLAWGGCLLPGPSAVTGDRAERGQCWEGTGQGGEVFNWGLLVLAHSQGPPYGSPLT